MDFAIDSLDEVVLGPRTAGVIVVVLDSYASGWLDIVYDVSGRAIAANLDLADGSMVRVVPTYGVTGSNCAIFLHPSELNKLLKVFSMIL